MDRLTLMLRINIILLTFYTLGSCSTLNENNQYVYQATIKNDSIYTIETDFISPKCSLNVYSKSKKKVFQKQFDMVLFIDSVSSGVIFLSKYNFSGTSNNTLKKVLSKTELQKLGFKSYNYKVDFFSDNYGGIGKEYKWKFIALKSDTLTYEDCLTQMQVSIPLNNVINFGGELRLKRNIERGLSFNPINNCEDSKKANLFFLDSILAVAKNK